MKCFVAILMVCLAVTCGFGAPTDGNRRARSPALSDDIQSSIAKSVKDSAVNVVSFKVEDLDFSLLDWKPPLHISKKFTYYLSGHDYENRPIWVLEFGKWDLRAIVEAGGEDLANFDKYIRQAATRAFKSMKEASTPEHPVNDVVVILDYDGLKIDQLTSIQTVAYGIKLARAYSELITQHLNSVLIINTSFVAHSVLNIARPVFGHIWDRLEVFGTNKAKWVPELKERFPPGSLPPWYGGNKDFQPVQVFG